jgi:flavin-dependent dehydrogenase
MEADYCIVATGARNPLRDVGTKWSPGNTMSSLGYYIPAHQNHVDLEFFPRFEGYIWIFPRAGHLSAGIAGKGKPASELRLMLDRYLSDKGIPTKDAVYYGHVIPSLERASWRENRVSGEGWLAVGDAMRSADIAATVLLETAAEGAAGRYRDLIWREFCEDLSVGARLSKRLFHGEFLRNDLSARMIQLIRRSPTVRAVVEDLFAGTQEYATLKERLKSGLHRTAWEIALSFLPRRTA